MNYGPHMPTFPTDAMSASGVWHGVTTVFVYVGALALLLLFVFKLIEVYNLLGRRDEDFPAQGQFDKPLWFVAIWLIPLAIGAAFYRMQVRREPVRVYVHLCWTVVALCALLVITGQISLLGMVSLLSLRALPLH